MDDNMFNLSSGSNDKQDDIGGSDFGERYDGRGNGIDIEDVNQEDGLMSGGIDFENNLSYLHEHNPGIIDQSPTLFLSKTLTLDDDQQKLSLDQNLQQQYHQMFISPPINEIPVGTEIQNGKMESEEADNPFNPIPHNNEGNHLNYQHLLEENDEQLPNSDPNAQEQAFPSHQFGWLIQELPEAGSIKCPPPAHFRNFHMPDSMSPPNLAVIQKNKQFFSLGKVIDVIHSCAHKLNGDIVMYEYVNVVRKYLCKVI